MTQPNLFTVAAASRLRDTGHAKVLGVVDEDVRYRIQNTWWQLCRSQPDVTSDDLWSRLGATELEALTYHPSLVGAILRASCVDGWVEDSGRAVKSSRVDARRRRIVVWTSKLYQEPKS